MPWWWAIVTKKKKHFSGERTADQYVTHPGEIEEQTKRHTGEGEGEESTNKTKKAQVKTKTMLFNVEY